MIELLAPAKNKKCAKAAIDFGADAIYIGASEFGARKNVPNSLLDIQEIAEYAHKFNVKVYITINTILTDDELKRAKKLIIELEKMGADAIIIQDMGFLSSSPLEGEGRVGGIPLHASTQCYNRTVEKVKFLESVGFSRVILARELSIEQIKKIKEQTNVELEAFIHGALCVSYSGQCYLSHMIGERSANRGECAQPCRKKYSLVDEEGNYIAKDKYLLCLKDFNASKHIKDLAEAGVTSFKIEGRLKDENYVKNVVGYYRKLIDNLGYKKTSSGKIFFDFEPNPEKSFNRGFTDYFLDGKRKEIFNFDSPKSMGEYIGKVSKVGKDYFEVKLPSTSHVSPLTSQDGLCFMNKDELSGCLVNKVEKNKIYPNNMQGITVGTEIYRNFDSEFEKKLKNSKTCRKIRVNIEFDLNKIKAIDKDGNISEINYSFEEIAQNAEKMGVNIANQFKKAGETEFLVENIKILTPKIPFLPVSKLNELRRELLEQLARCKDAKTQGCKEKQTYNLISPSSYKLDYKANILNISAKEFYEKCGFEIEELALESGKVPKTGKVAMTCKHCLKYAFNMCKSPKKLYIIDEKSKKYELKFDCQKCEMQVIF